MRSSIPGQSGRVDAHTGTSSYLACAESLIENAEPMPCLRQAYDADAFVNALTQRGITAVITPRPTENPAACDFALYRERNLIERFFNQSKHFRASPHLRQVARNFLAGLRLAAITILLN